MFFRAPMSLRLNAGNGFPDNPSLTDRLSCSDSKSLMIRRILPPLYMKYANPSQSTLMAEEEKNPSFRSNVLALQSPSEKKPIGSHSLCDWKRLLLGHITFVFSIFVYMKQFEHSISSPNMSARVAPFCFALFSSCLLMTSSFIFRILSGFIRSARLSPWFQM